MTGQQRASALARMDRDAAQLLDFDAARTLDESQHSRRSDPPRQRERRFAIGRDDDLARSLEAARQRGAHDDARWRHVLDDELACAAVGTDGEPLLGRRPGCGEPESNR